MPPKLTVSNATTKVNHKIKLKGQGFTPDELVGFTVTYTINWFDGPGAVPNSAVVTQQYVQADQDGKFKVSFKLSQAGEATIKAKGKDSHMTASVVVEVKAKKKKKHHDAALAAPAETNRLVAGGQDITAHDAALAGKTTLLASDSNATIRTPLGALGTLALLLGGGLMVGRSLRRRRHSTE